MLLILLSIVAALLLLYRGIKNKNSDYWKLRYVPFVKNETPLGVLWDLIVSGKPLAEVYKGIYDEHRTEPYVGMFLGCRPVLLLRDPVNIQSVLVGDFKSFHSRGIVTNPNDKLTDNIVFMDDYRRWKLMRQKLSPVFTSAKLKNMFYILERCARDFVDFVDENKNSFEDQFDLLYTYTIAAVAASVFGIDAQTTSTMNSPFLDMARRAVTPNPKSGLEFVIGNTSPFLLKWLDLKPFGQFDYFIGIVKNVLSKRGANTEKRHDFIDICLELQKNGTMRDDQTDYSLEPTDELLAAQAFFFFVAGTDTSANSMHFTLLELSNNPDILVRVHKEVDEVFDACEDKLTYDDMEKFKCLEMVLSEALRKYPPAGLLQRKCNSETALPVGGLKLQKGDVVTVPIFALHRDEKYFPNPEKFDPERLTPENIAKQQKCTYIPFGDGNRVCLGARFARLQVLAGLAWLLRRYTLRPQNVTPQRFQRSFFGIRAPDVRFQLLQR